MLNCLKMGQYNWYSQSDLTMKILLIQIVFLIKVSTSFPVDEELFRSNGNFPVINRALKDKDFASYGFDVNTLSADVKEDAFLTTPELIAKYGYPIEIHSVQTADNYILEMHRIPRPGAQPVFLQHGIMDSSAGWIIMGPHSSLGYYLYDLGYDVWLGNNRGNRYSKNHTYLSTKSKKFWDFTFHEIGNYDIPAMFDHILEATNFTRAHYIGHSQGTTAFWVMCNYKPKHCDKALSINALAPVAFISNTKSILLKAISLIVNQIDRVTSIFGMHEFLPTNNTMTKAGQVFCKEEAMTQALCYNAIFLLSGFNSEQLNKTMLPVIMAHLPAGISIKQLIHYGQEIRSKKFQLFDHGWWGNWKLYGSLNPPSYDLSKVNRPVALHYSSNDWISDVADVQKLKSGMKNVTRSFLVASPKFNHLDFLYAIDSRKLVYDKIVKILKYFDN